MSDADWTDVVGVGEGEIGEKVVGEKVVGEGDEEDVEEEEEDLETKWMMSTTMPASNNNIIPTINALLDSDSVENQEGV